MSTEVKSGLHKDIAVYDRVMKMKFIFERFSTDLPTTARTSKKPLQGSSCVILTGSTGSLGSYILDALISNPSISCVYCLYRGGRDGEARQKDLQSRRGLNSSWLPERLKFLICNLSQPYLGLGSDEYVKLPENVTHILHNAWQVDFNLSIDSFVDTHIHGVRQFVGFSSRSAKRAEIFFISSIGTVMEWSNTSERVPEAVIDDWTLPHTGGYAESKYVSEKLLLEAGKVGDVPSIICRVGQVAGPTLQMGTWNEQEWVPSLIKSSKHLRKLPASLGRQETIDWIPVDILGNIIVAKQRNNSITPTLLEAPEYITLLNPSKTTWSEILPTIQRFIEADVVSLQDWVDALHQSSSTNEIDKNPALKLLGFFDGLQESVNQLSPTMDTTNAVQESSTMEKLGIISSEWISNWMRRWGY
ncbi:hypothetical protein AOQ84DRAFT_280861 [Glonium stellatum]|uniref:Thioester reductase (TE) domain-containing protein n=1 Tax=Glonium stellatum TaxID=574774 RepID=A0A8E2FDP0_9PEZI|nr:hypothetical protein AOQ84DRAFT_280861 [Glonium stellatum]